MKKKLMALTLASGMLLTQTVSAATMYALDGRTLEVNDNEIEAYRQVNWYYGKPVTMYALDGRTLTVGENDVEMYRQVGWYYGKPVTMYALDGRTLTVGENDVEMYRQVNWYYGKPVTMYAPDGRTLTVGANDVEMYKKVGWYTYMPYSAKYTPYIGTWWNDYPSASNTLKITGIHGNAITFDFWAYRLANYENLKAYIHDNGTVTFSNSSMTGSIKFYDSSIVLTITSSERSYLVGTYTFPYNKSVY